MNIHDHRGSSGRKDTPKSRCDLVNMRKMRSSRCYICLVRGHAYWNCPNKNRRDCFKKIKNVQKAQWDKFGDTIIPTPSWVVVGSDERGWNDIWYISDEYPRHMTGNINLFKHFKAGSIGSNGASKKGLKVEGFGEIEVSTDAKRYLIPGIYYVPNCALNTLSLSQLLVQGFRFLSDIGQANESQSTEREDIGSMKSNTTSRGLGKQTERSVVRNHFTEFVDSYGKKICRCNYCAEEYDCASNFGTSTTLMNHIKSCASYPAHQTQTQTQSKFSFTATKVEETGEKNVSLLAWRFDQKVARKSITEMIIMDRLPFEFVENEGFRRCMKTCQPDLVIPSLSTVTRDCYELFVDEKEKLKAQLNQSTIRVCLTIDTWTSLQRINYLCLTAHFIDNNWKLQKKVINFCPISSRRGRDIGRAVELCLVDWGLQNIFTVTVDNASSNDTAIDYLKNNVVKGGDLCLLKGKWTHVRSMTRVMNLVVRDLIKEMSSSVDRVRASVSYVRDSPAILKKFKELVKLERIECQKSLCVDVPTRWNSTYLMLSVAIVYERAFDRLAIEDFVYRSILGEGCGVPSSFDWDNVKKLVGFLQQYYQLTLRVSGTKYITSNTFLDSISCIHSVFKECFSSEDDELREMSSRMKSKFDKYWGKNDKFNLLVFIASVFDPRAKFKYLEVTLCNMYGDDDGRKIVALCRSALYELFHDYTRVHSHQHSSSQVRTQSYTPLAQSIPRVGLEMDRYLTEESEGDNEYFQSEDFTILDWWKRKSTNFPILSRVARDVLAIPISTVGYQSSFSTTTKGNVLDLFTTSLTPKTIQALICYQDWIRSCDVPVNVEEHMQELNVFQDGNC